MQINLADVGFGQLLLLKPSASVKVDVEAGVVIHFEHPSLKFSINKQVESQNLERLALDVILAW